MGELGNLGTSAAPPPARRLNQIGQPDDGMLGYSIRRQLYPGEDAYFRSNPNVAGMAAETGDVILNPYSPPNVNRDAVARNEAFRLHLRDRKVTPTFGLTDQQRQSFVGTPYANDEEALRATIAARIYSGDPSAQATPEQQQWLQQFLGGQR